MWCYPYSFNTLVFKSIFYKIRKSNDYAVNYYLVEDKTQEEVCKIFKCNPRSLMRWVERYKKDDNALQETDCLKKNMLSFKTITLQELLQKLKEGVDLTITQIFRRYTKNHKNTTRTS